MSASLFTPHFKQTPYWWDAAARPVEDEQASLPSDVQVLVVGSGYTGLHAGLQTARAGMSTLIVDADELGAGCSSRNGGQVSYGVKGSFSELASKHGPQLATDLLADGVRAMDFLETFIADEGIECAWARVGRFSGAHNSRAYDAMASTLATTPKAVATEWHMVSKAEQHSEIGSDFYQGGAVFPNDAALQPAQYHAGLLQRVRSAGATTIGHCAVLTIEKAGAGYLVHTSRGPVRAGQVAIATNGYTGGVTPWLRRRVIPIGSYIIATEPFDRALADEISPHNRVMSDSRRLVFYYRLSPDRTRMIFGGRVALKETDPKMSAPRLHDAMSQIFPQLTDTGVSHSWLGFVGYTFDTLPHTGVYNGLHYAMGYCGSGVSLSSYCGAKMGRRIAGLEEADTAFDRIRFQTRPMYSGNPWFLKPAVLYYKLRDRLNF